MKGYLHPWQPFYDEKTYHIACILTLSDTSSLQDVGLRPPRLCFCMLATSFTSRLIDPAFDPAYVYVTILIVLVFLVTIVALVAIVLIIVVAHVRKSWNSANIPAWLPNFLLKPLDGCVWLV